MYIYKKDIHQYTDGRGYVFANRIYGENQTEVSFIQRLQGETKEDRHTKYNRVIFSITFGDVKVHITNGYNDKHDYKQSLYVNYALDLMEQNSLEEFYKVALLLTKSFLEKYIEFFNRHKQERQKKGYWSYPIIESPRTYIRRNAKNKKIVKSIDVTEEDLVYFKSYIE